MAITAATLTTTVSESITLNGQTFGNTVTKTHASVKDLLTRTIVVPHGSTITTLYTVSTTEGGSAFAPTDIKYVRITNTDTTKGLSNCIENEEGHEVLFNLFAGCSYFINGYDDSLRAQDTTGSASSGEYYATYEAASICYVL